MDKEIFTTTKKEVKVGKNTYIKEIVNRRIEYDFDPERDVEKLTEFSGFGRGTVYIKSTRVAKPKVETPKKVEAILHKKDGRTFIGNKEIKPQIPVKKVMVDDLIAKYKKVGHF